MRPLKGLSSGVQSSMGVGNTGLQLNNCGQSSIWPTEKFATLKRWLCLCRRMCSMFLSLPA